MPRISTRLLAASGLVFSCACATPEDERWFQRLEEEHIDTREWYPEADSILQGFDPPPDSDSPLLTGDRILYGVSISRPGERKTWLVHMEVVDSSDGVMMGKWTETTEDGDATATPMTAIGARIRITLYDGEGSELGANESRVPGTFLMRGLHTASRESYAIEQLPDEGRTEEDTDRMRQRSRDGLTAFIAFVELVRENELLSPILFEAMPTPNLLGVLFNLGVTVKAGPAFNAAVPYDGFTGEAWGKDAFRLPMLFEVNGDPALLCSAIVVPPRSPFHVGSDR